MNLDWQRFAMVTRNEALQELTDLSKFISDRIRTLNFGTLAVCWALFAENNKPPFSATNRETYLFSSSSLALLSLAFDFLQFLFGYIMLRSIIKNTKPEEPIIYTNNTLKFLRSSCFNLKILLGLSSYLMVVLVFIDIATSAWWSR